MKKITVVSPFSVRISGPDKTMEVLKPAMADRGYDLTLLRPGDIHIDRIRRSFSPIFWINYLLSLKKSVPDFLRLFKNTTPHAVIINMESTIGAAIAANKLEIPVIICFNGTLSTGPAFLLSPLIKYISSLAFKIVTPSPLVKTFLGKLGVSKEISLIPNPVDQEKFKITRPENKNSSFTIGYAGRFHPCKRLDILINAAASVRKNIKNLKLIFMGESVLKEEKQEQKKLVKMTHKLQLEDCTLWLPPGDVSDFMRSLDIFVLPSEKESFGRVMFEALCCGTKCIVSSSVGSLPLLPREMGKFIFRSNDKNSLVEKILQTAFNKADDEIVINKLYPAAKKITDPKATVDMWEKLIKDTTK